MKKSLVLLSMVSLALLASCGKQPEKPATDVTTWTTTESNMVVPSEEPTTATVSMDGVVVEMENDEKMAMDAHTGADMEKN